MKKLAILVGILVLAMGSAQAGTVTTNTVAPTVDGEDIAMLNLTGSSGQGKFWPGEGFAAGQTFTTGNISGWFFLHAVTIRYHGTYDPLQQNTEFDPTKKYGVRIVTLSGTTITQLYDEEFVHSVPSRCGDFLTFHLSAPFEMDPNTEYGFDVRMKSSTSGWSSGIPTVTYNSDTYAGGKYYTCSQWTDGNKADWSATDLGVASINASRDWVFHLDIEARYAGMVLLVN